MGIIMTEGVVAPQDVYAPLSRRASHFLKVSLPSLSHPCSMLKMAGCLGGRAKNSSSLENSIFTGFLVFKASCMHMNS